MPINRTYGPSAGLVASMGYDAGAQLQQNDDTAKMLQILSSIYGQNQGSAMQQRQLDEQKRQADQSNQFQQLQLYATNPGWRQYVNSQQNGNYRSVPMFTPAYMTPGIGINF